MDKKSSVFQRITHSSFLSRVRKQLGSKWFRLIATALVLVLFVWYILNNKEEFHKLGNLTLAQFLLIFLGQIIIFVANIGLIYVLVKMVPDKKLTLLPATRVVAYSSVINFFGFLQGGLGFRGLYLKKVVRVPLKTYTVLTLFQYLIFFGFVAAALVVSLGALGFYSNWLVSLIVFGTGIGIAGLIFMRSFINSLLRKVSISLHKPHYLFLILLLTIFQFSGLMLAYATELSAIGAHISFWALVLFASIAGFSIIFAVTPGAIGVREGLLLLAQSQLGITTDQIILSSTLDRIIYCILLLAILPLAINFKKKTAPNETASPETTSILDKMTERQN